MSHRQEVAEAVSALGEFAAGLDLAAVDEAARARLALTIVDTLGVGLAGAETPELTRLREVWPLPAGPARLWGDARTTDIATATLLNGTAVCSLELDEGNKYARGHPAAHVVPVAVALAEHLPVSGVRLLTAVLAGYEVAARFARAATPRPGLHPHGNWGATGAAAAVGVLYGLNAPDIARAIDAACGLTLATGFDSALAGSFVRNTWVGCAGTAGLAAVQIVRAGLGTVDGTAAGTLGDLLGTIEPALLTEDLGRRLDISGGYFKRHASCSYTHPPADAAIVLRERHPGLRPSDIAAVEVATHRLATPLAHRNPPTRLAAMFSIPYVVSVALRDGACPPASFSDEARADPELRSLVERVTVHHDPGLDARLPAERVARLRVTLTGGEELVVEVPNPIGDAAHHPFGRPEIDGKLAGLLGDAAAGRVGAAADALWTAADAAAALAGLTGPSEVRRGEE